MIGNKGYNTADDEFSFDQGNAVEGKMGAGTFEALANPNPTVKFTAPGLTDAQAAEQWHLAKLGSIATVWEEYTGKGVKVGVYDSGVEYGHYDLDNNYDASLQVTIGGKTYDGDWRPASGTHGTAVAGLIAAERNGVGTVGVSYDATVTGVNIFDPYSGGGTKQGIFVNANDPTLFFEALQQSNKFDVVNHSWGGGPNYGRNGDRNVEGTFANSMAKSFEYVAETGRGGLGTISVKAAGNDRVDGEGQSDSTTRHTIAVAAYREADSYASYYSTRGAHLLVSAPSSDYTELGGSGVVATDRSGRLGYNTSFDPGGEQDYTDGFGGTSAATPMVSGVVSLMLDANENLGWRDVREILASSATLPVAFDTPRIAKDFTFTQQGYTFTQNIVFNDSTFKLTGKDANWNGGAYHYSTDYGFGAVNALAAVRMAEAWSYFGSAKTSANETSFSTGALAVNMQSTSGTEYVAEKVHNDFTATPATFTFTLTDNIDLEHVDMHVVYDTLNYGSNQFTAGTLKVKVTAPDGTEAFTDMIFAGAEYLNTNNVPQQSFTLGFSNFRGVDPRGQWKLEFQEHYQEQVTTIKTAEFKFYGATPNANDVHTYTDEFATMAAIAGESGRQVLSDTDGGTDWINAAAVTSDVNLSLVAGTSTTFGGVAGFTIATETLIENAVTGDGNDVLTGNALDNELRGMRGDDSLFGAAGNDRLYGGAGTDILFGGEGNDLLDGGKGADLMTGGVGNDSYVLDDTGDQMIETANGGYDTVWSGISHTLGANFEALYLTGTAAIDATGNDGDNVIVGNMGNNRLSGGAGNDTLATVSGNMTIVARGGFDTIDGGSGTDTLQIGGVRSDYQVLTSGGQTYIITNGSAVAVSNIEAVKIGFGSATTLGNAGVTAFDALNYIAGYSDLRIAFGTDAAKGAAHFVDWGFNEGRSLVFNGLDYIASYADLRKAFGADMTAGARHFIDYGAGEQRATTFDGWKYLASYGDLIQAFGADETAAARHYITYGADEGRVGTFDAMAYAMANSDLLAAFGTDADALARHYVTWGFAEGRSLGKPSGMASTSAATQSAASSNVMALSHMSQIDAFTTASTNDNPFGDLDFGYGNSADLFAYA